MCFASRSNRANDGARDTNLCQTSLAQTLLDELAGPPASTVVVKLQPLFFTQVVLAVLIFRILDNPLRILRESLGIRKNFVRRGAKHQRHQRDLLARESGAYLR